MCRSNLRYEGKDVTIEKNHARAEAVRSCLAPSIQPLRFSSGRRRHVGREVREGPTGGQQPGRRGRERAWKQPSVPSTFPGIIRRINWIVGGTWKLNWRRAGRREGLTRCNSETGNTYLYRRANTRVYTCSITRARTYTIRTRIYIELFEAPRDFGCVNSTRCNPQCSRVIWIYARIFR